MTMNSGMYGMGGMQYGMNPSLQIAQGKGKGKSREEDFEAAFAQAAASLTAVEPVEDADGGVASLENAMKEASLESKEQGSDFRECAFPYHYISHKSHEPQGFGMKCELLR